MASPEAVQRVVDAWTDKGPCPVYHEYIEGGVRASWPVLAEALDALAAEPRESVWTRLIRKVL